MEAGILDGNGHLGGEQIQDLKIVRGKRTASRLVVDRYHSQEPIIWHTRGATQAALIRVRSRK